MKNIEFIDNLIPKSQEIIRNPEVLKEAAGVDYCDRAVRFGDFMESVPLPIKALKNTFEKVIEAKRLEISP